MDPLIRLVTALCLALLFGTAAVAKIRDLRRFRATLADYALLPPVLLTPFTWLVPALEGLLALAWLAGFGGPLLAGASAALLAGYAAAMAANLLRGRTDFGCGCSFGKDDRVTWWLVLRNAVLAVAALPAAMPVGDRSLGGADFALAGAALPALVLLYLAAQQLIANAAAITRGRQPAAGAR